MSPTTLALTPDGGAMDADASRAEETAAGAQAKRRSPIYHIFEMQTLYSDRDPIGETDAKRKIAIVKAWVQIASDVSAPTDKKAIESIIGTLDDPRDGFDAKRRLHPFWAVLTRDYNPRQRTQTVVEDWA